MAKFTAIILALLLITTFTIAVWNMYLPLSSSRNTEFVDYVNYSAQEAYATNSFVSNNFHQPIVMPISDSLKNVGFIADQTPALNVGQRQLYDNDDPSKVVLSFYVQYGNQQNLIPLLDLLHEYKLEKAIFFVEKRFIDDHEFVIKRIQSQGYTVKIWQDLDGYDSRYAPTVYRGIPLIESEILSQVNKDRDAIELYRIALHYYEFSTAAFTPKIMTHKIILEDILKENNKSLTFVDYTVEESKDKNRIAANGTAPEFNGTSVRTNSSLVPEPVLSDLRLNAGTWTMRDLTKSYPDDVSFSKALDAYVVSRPIVIGEQSQLLIENDHVLLRSIPRNNVTTTFLEVRGEALLNNSSISSWDDAVSRPDTDPYKPRPYIVIRGGHLDIYNSTISHLGYSLGGLSDTRYAHAALEYYNSHDFVISNSTIAFNYYGFYSEDSDNFKIVNNKVYGQTRYGLDPHTRSSDFVVDSNHVHDNGNQGIICSLYCENVTITNNLVEYNVEGIGLHWLTNSSIVKDNIVRYNEKYGIFVQKDSFNNIVEDNTVIGNRIGIGLLEGSQNNTVRNNLVADNVVERIRMDEDSQGNLIGDNKFS